uniref:ADP-ribosylation factor-like protein 2 n=1 Tax=Timema shepardi TaxID=629360 RepID=A0A7R9ARG3_TIMSH|nr:unnamed protein product [Timema shepardi]
MMEIKYLGKRCEEQKRESVQCVLNHLNILILFRFMLNIWDVGGQKSLRSYWRNYFESTDGLIWVVDCADKRRLDDCRKELHELLQEEILELNMIKTHNWKIVGCSAVTGDNLVAGIDWLVSDISSRIFTLD